MIIFKCEECGKLFKGKNEYEAEVAFDQHECIRKFEDMPMEDLIKYLKERGK